MKSVLAISILCLFLYTSIATAREIRREQIDLSQGKGPVSLTGEIKGYDIEDYHLEADAGQRLTIDFEANNLAAYFNLLPPGSNDIALFIGSTSGNHFEAELPVDGLYTIRVYMMRSAARRNETANYRLKISTEEIINNTTTMPSAQIVPNRAFHQTLELMGIRFRIASANNSSINKLTIEPSGLEIDNSILVREIEGIVTGAEIADLNADNSPEIYIYVSSSGSGSYGSLVAYSANRRKSLSEIYLPPLNEKDDASKGYMGHDEFAVLEGVLGRRFPVYLEGDSNTHPTGGMRQLQYKLEMGEAGWVLRADRMIEY